MYTTIEALSTINWVELINKREFAKVALDKNSETFIVHDVALVATTADGIKVHSFRASQLDALQWDKVLTKILTKYTNYVYVFLFDLAIELPENTGINKYAIELIEGKQSPYGPIYALSTVELETLKTYIKTHIKIEFI